MNLVTWIQNNFITVGSILAWIHMGLGIFGNITKSKTVNGIDDVITNILATFFKNQTETPKA